MTEERIRGYEARESRTGEARETCADVAWETRTDVAWETPTDGAREGCDDEARKTRTDGARKTCADEAQDARADEDGETRGRGAQVTRVDEVRGMRAVEAQEARVDEFREANADAAQDACADEVRGMRAVEAQEARADEFREACADAAQDVCADEVRDACADEAQDTCDDETRYMRADEVRGMRADEAQDARADEARRTRPHEARRTRTHEARRTRAYWDARHRERDALASGGHIGLDRPGNEIFYAQRLGALLTLIGDLSNPEAPLFVLDAGCGKGHFARGLARCGHRVDAFDASPEAITHARDEGGGPRYAVSGLTDFRNPWPYDIVLCVDVLFHVLDDAEWAASLRNLTSLVRVTGRLIVTDEDGPGRTPRGDYILHRPTDAYRTELEPLGLAHTRFQPYGFRENRVGFHVFTRTR